MLSLLVTLLILILILGVIIWVIGQLPIEQPFKSIAYALVGLIVVFYLIAILAGGVPVLKLQ
jgi:hypothetical protein